MLTRNEIYFMAFKAGEDPNMGAASWQTAWYGINNVNDASGMSMLWIRDNDIVIIAPWDFKEDERGDIVWRFTLPQVQWLKDNNHIPKDF